MPLLQIQTGKHSGKTIRLIDGTLIIGRGDSADLKIASAEISREHCCVRTDGEEVFVCDLGSANGTFINGIEIRGYIREVPATGPIEGEVALPIGARLHVGPMAFQRVDPSQPLPKPKTKSATKRRKVAASVLDSTKPKPKKAGGDTATEDDALAWLTEDVPNPASEEADTSIMSAQDVAEAKRSPGSDRLAVPPPSSDSFDTIAAEAQDIFRRHRLMQQAQQQQ